MSERTETVVRCGGGARCPSLSCILVVAASLIGTPSAAFGAPEDAAPEQIIEPGWSPDGETGEVVPWEELSGKLTEPGPDESDVDALPVVPVSSGSSVELALPQELLILHEDLSESPLSESLDKGGGGGGTMAMTSSPCDNPRICRSQRCDPAKVVCSDDSIHNVPLFIVDVWSNNLIEVRTSELRTLAGETEGRPDTVVYLLWCSDPTCMDGDIVAIDDDGNDETECTSDSKLVVSPPEMGVYAVVVAGKCGGMGGIADIEIKVNSSTYNWTNRVFGGMTVRSVESRTGDSVFVGKSPNSSVAGYAPDPEYHDSMMWVFSTSATNCTTGCGQFLFNDDAIPSGLPQSRLLLSKVDIPEDFPGTNNAILVGTFRGSLPSSPYTINGRVMRYRRHASNGGSWTGAPQQDLDGDGLSRELEGLLGSCDDSTDATTGIGVTGMTCLDYANLVNGYRNDKTARECEIGSTDPFCWNAGDSDNDGIPDDWEVFGGVVRCAHPPQPPYQDAGACPRLGLHGDLSGCVDNGACYALDVSALSDPDPGAYDVYVNNDYWACTGPWCASIHKQGLLDATHRMAPAQQGWLSEVWTDEPRTCWDGSLPPCSDPADRPYRARIHVYDGVRRDVPDCKGGYALPMGGRGTRNFWNYQFDPRRRFMGFFRFALGADGKGGGQTDGGTPVLIWANLQSEVTTYHTISHEVGHTLGLEHTFQNAVGKSKDCDGGCPSVVTNCHGNGCVNHINPQVASLMSYEHKKFLPKSPNLPGACDVGCDYVYSRFSKGLNLPLDEGSLVELFDNGPHGWRTRKRVQDLFCLEDGNAPSPANPNVCAGACDDTFPVDCVSYGSQCLIDWNRSATADLVPYALDLTYGRFDADPQTDCDEDVLEDTNEWLSIFALGKDRLDVVRVPAGEDNRAFTDFHFYADSFNGIAPTNLLAAPITVESSVTMTEDNYPTNITSAPSDCPTLAIQVDTCTGPGDCASGICESNRCACTDNSQCRSFYCQSSGSCSVASGVCTCAVDDDCPGGGGCATTECGSSRFGRTKQPDSNYEPAYYAAALAGPGSSSYLRLSDQGSSGITDTVTLNDAFGVLMELRFDGFAVGQARQTVATSGAFEIAIVSEGGLPMLEVSSSSNPPLVFPGREVGQPLEPGRWYRIRVGRWDGEVFVTVVAWNKLTGWYDNDDQGGGCVWTTWPSPLQPTGDIWLGYDGVTDSDRFSGALDNLTIANMRVGGTGKTATCEQQQ